METEPKWLSALRELDISKTVFTEFDDNSQDYTPIKNFLYRIISATKNLLIIPQEHFLEFYKSDYPFKIGALDNLLIQLPKTDFFQNKLKEQYHVALTYSYITKDGVTKDLPKISLRYSLNYDKSKILDEEVNNNYYNIFVLGENLAFNNIKFIEEVQNKDSQCILFTYLEKLNIFVFFLDSYWEVKRTTSLPPMTFNEFVGIESEKNDDVWKNGSLIIENLNMLLDNTSNKKPKKSFLGIKF